MSKLRREGDVYLNWDCVRDKTSCFGGTVPKGPDYLGCVVICFLTDNIGPVVGFDPYSINQFIPLATMADNDLVSE